MPNFDTGHYFLTTLAPIRNGTVADDRGVTVSFQQKLKMLLAILPTALQSPATVNIGLNSPFSRNRRTHLARFMVLDDVIYNGRNSPDAIVTSLSTLAGDSSANPIITQHADNLNTAYLMFAADFDAVKQDGDPLPATLTPEEQDAVRDAYARRLWETMEAELRQVYSNCVGFEKVNDAAGFADYLARCQVETTMSFHDYWITPPDLKTLNIKAIAFGVGLPFAGFLLTLIGWLFGMASFWLPFVLFVILAVAVVVSYRKAMALGMEPMPPERFGDLPSVLKSLYTQQTFSEFAIEAQGKSDAELHDAFGAYLAQHQPKEKMAPSQAPGVISIAAEQGVIS